MFKKVFIITILLFVIAIPAFSQTDAPQTAAPSVPYTNSSYCYRMFSGSPEKLFYLTMSAITENNYAINEVQTKEGYILFAAGNKEFLATVANIDDKSALVKIAPADNSYYFAQSIVNNIFAYIVQNIDAEPEVFIKGK